MLKSEKCLPVDTITFASRLWAVTENMTQMSITHRTHDFSAGHERNRPIHVGLHIISDVFIVRWPSSTTVEFRAGAAQHSKTKNISYQQFLHIKVLKIHLNKEVEWQKKCYEPHLNNGVLQQTHKYIPAVLVFQYSLQHQTTMMK